MTPDEQISSNAQTGTPVISICVPTWRDDASALLGALANMDRVGACEILIYDDGSNDPALTAALTARLETIEAPARLITARENHGRSHARNRLIHHASANWLLLLDADMVPDSARFLADYADTVTTEPAPALIAGGFSLNRIVPTRPQRLHAAQSRASECLPATTRQKAPGRYVFTSNILVHRTVLETVSFDEAYTGWGWEDVDWGLNVAGAFPVRHIDNTATHLGLDEAGALLGKYESSGENFARLVSRHPAAAADMTLYKAARRLKAIPGTGAVKWTSRALAADRAGLTPMPVRLFALKLFRAAVYAEALS